MTIDAAKLADARALVRDVLSKKQTDQNNPALHDGDVLTFQVALVEQHDPAWLQTQLNDPRFAKDARLQVALQLRGPLRKPLLTALGAPAFLIGR
jgi:exosome complex RNA-binding protein Rrp4